MEPNAQKQKQLEAGGIMQDKDKKEEEKQKLNTGKEMKDRNKRGQEKARKMKEAKIAD